MRVPAQGVNRHRKVVAFEVENGDVFGLQSGPPVANIHAYPVYQMIAVSLDNHLPSIDGDLAEQGSEGRLSARVEMNFGLLKQEHPEARPNRSIERFSECQVLEFVRATLARNIGMCSPSGSDMAWAGS